MRSSLTSLLVSFTLFGCGQAFQEEVVPIDKIPPQIMEAAQKELPDIQFEQAWKTKDGEKELYEIRGKNKKGQIKEVEIFTDGKVYKVE